MSEPKPIRSGKIYDPVFLCTLGAVILAILSSVLLRVVVSGSGPSAAHAETPVEKPVEYPMGPPR